MKSKTYQIAVGVSKQIKINIQADSTVEAFSNATDFMNQLYKEQARESPVTWNFTILSVTVN